MNQERFRANLNRRLGVRRAAFTLVELLMVIVVIGILSSLLVVASMSVLGTSREAATKATIIKISMLLDQRMAALNRHIDRKISQTPNLSPEKIIYLRKDETRKYFPQSWDEAKLLMDEADIPPLSQPATDPNSATESSEVLYFILTSTTVPNDSGLAADPFLASEFVVPAGNDDIFPKGNRRPYFIDSWSKPIRFYRWPTRLVRPDGYTYDYDMSQADSFVAPVAPSDEQLAVARSLNPNLLNGIITRPTLPADIDLKRKFDTDVDDPLRILDPDEPADPTNAGQIQAWNDSVLNFEKNYHTYGTNHEMLVISSGVDGEFGLYLSNSPSPSNPSFNPNTNGRLCMPIAGESNKVFDNLTNLNVVAGMRQ